MLRGSARNRARPGTVSFGMGGMHLRALRNGLVAAVLTAVVGFALNALVSSDGSSVAERSPAPTGSPSPSCVPEARGLDRAALRAVGGRFQDVWFDSARRAWAVGWLGVDDASATPVLAAWDGDVWTPSDAGDLGTGALNAVGGSGPDDVWAVGWSTPGLGRDTLALHYDGAAWSAVPAAPDGELSDVLVLAPDDAWAVGWLGDPSQVKERATALHWDGATWNEVAVPAGSGRSGLTSIAGTAEELWAVGYRRHGPLVERFDGTSWQRVDALDEGGPLRAVALRGSTIWLAGSAIRRGDGSSFERVAVAPDGGSFSDVTPLGGGRALAVGSISKGDRSRSFALQVAGASSIPIDLGAPGSDALEAAAVVRGQPWLAGWRETRKGTSPIVAIATTCP
jgi:hypothetical protein